MGVVLRALLRRPAGPLLLLLEVAIGMTIVLQSANLVAPVMERTSRPPGYAVEGAWIVTREAWDGAALPDADARLAAAPGVRAAAAVSTPPFHVAGEWAGLRTAPGAEPKTAWMLAGAPALADALGLTFAAGRAPAAEGEIAVTEALALRLFPGVATVDVPGRTLQDLHGRVRRIAGVVDRMTIAGAFYPERDDTVLAVAEAGDPGRSHHVVRTDPGAAEADVAAAAEAALGAGPRVWVRVQPLAALKGKVEVIARTTSWAVLAIAALVVGVVAVGVFAMANLLVAGRAREIGIRRALGATRGDVVRYFLLENWLLMTGGIAAGLVLTALTREAVWAMPLPFALAPARVVPAALLFWCVGAAATLGPARRASRVPPVQATRGR